MFDAIDRGLQLLFPPPEEPPVLLPTIETVVCMYVPLVHMHICMYVCMYAYVRGFIL